MSDELKRLLDLLPDRQMTPEEIREQAISFAYGNGHIEDSRITREDIARAVDEIYGVREPRSTK
jgi:hypothetical protein